MLAAAPMQEQKQMLGERLFPLIQVERSLDKMLTYGFLQRQHADLAGKITGMLLEIDNSELLHMLEDSASLQGKVNINCFPIHLGDEVGTTCVITRIFRENAIKIFFTRWRRR